MFEIKSKNGVKRKEMEIAINELKSLQISNEETIQTYKMAKDRLAIQLDELNNQ